MGLFLSPTDPGTIGGTNGDLGIGGLPDAIAFGIDFFYNSNKGTKRLGRTQTKRTKRTVTQLLVSVQLTPMVI
ncbi:lectin-like domain-containing protein [Weissella cibaria]|uniref:lectin-like domain-containing protein n=1 Tax=Weissella cibaria TaxID=137591 RepID=UPI0039B6F9F5